MTYNEYWQVIDAGIKAEDLIVTFKYSKTKAWPRIEDGHLRPIEDKLADPAFKAKDWSSFVRGLR